jgi:hypothetical protein
MKCFSVPISALNIRLLLLRVRIAVCRIRKLRERITT